MISFRPRKYNIKGWTLTIRVGRLPSDSKGYFEQWPESKLARITLWKELSEVEAVATLCHELVHFVDAVFEEQRADLTELMIMKALKDTKLLVLEDD